VKIEEFSPYWKTALSHEQLQIQARSASEPVCPQSFTRLRCEPEFAKTWRCSIRSLKNRSFLPLLVIAALSTPTIAQVDNDATEPRITNSLPYRQQPADYFGSQTNDRMRQTIDRFEKSGKRITSNGTGGYLKSLLKALDIPVESQLLVYSKTARNPQLVSPSNPRAVYFNDDTYVGWVPGASTIEIVSLDPGKGAIFYTVRQPTSVTDSTIDSHTSTQAVSSAAAANIRRETRCLTCHVSSRTFQVPGVLVGSYLTDETGKPVSGYSNIDLSTRWEKRFGGWYVTGDGTIKHLGNRVLKDGATARLFSEPNDDHGSSFKHDLYAVTTSDMVAHLVLQHQIRVHNLLIRVVYESAFARNSDAVDRLCRELLFATEIKLPERLSPTRFSSQFAGPNDANPLREFDLKQRLFSNPVSFLLTSTLFNRLDNDVRKKILTRLWEHLHEPKTVTSTQKDRNTAIVLIRKHVERLPAVWMNTPAGTIDQFDKRQ
jgi:hypothetical protein